MATHTLITNIIVLQTYHKAMIDYVKILLSNPNIENLKNNPLLDFKMDVSISTGEYSNKLVSDYHFCKITIFDTGTVLFTGSIHKLWNSLNQTKAPNHNKGTYRGFNGNLFTLSDINQVRLHLTNLLGSHPSEMQFQNIEFGINLEVIFNPQKFIKGLLYLSNKKFEFRYNDYYAQSTHQRYIFKIYNKSNQYSMNNYTIRIESKEVKSIEFRNRDIRTFDDINQNTLSSSAEKLIERFSKVVYYDYTLKKNLLTKNETKCISNYSNPRFWFEDIKPNRRDRHLKNLNKLILSKSKNLKKIIRDEMEKKCVIINRLSQDSKCVIINTSNIELDITQNLHSLTPINSSLELEYKNNRNKYDTINTKSNKNDEKTTDYEIHRRKQSWNTIWQWTRPNQRR